MDAETRLQAILKAVVVGAEERTPASLPGGEASSELFTSAGALEPPYDPLALCLLMEHSNSLRQNVDAYAVNIDGFGHRPEPAIDFEDKDADERVAGGADSRGRRGQRANPLRHPLAALALRRAPLGGDLAGSAGVAADGGG